MRIVRVLYRQHIDRMFKKHWRIQGQRVSIETGAEAHLKELGIPVYDPNELVKEARKIYKLDIIGMQEKPVQFNQTHPDWHDEVCYFNRDSNVVLLGEEQAKNITNCVQIQEGLPYDVENVDITSEQSEKICSAILSSHVYDTEQKLLPKRKDPLRPAWVFPRDYGITVHRKCLLMITRLLHLCETEEVANKRLVVDNVRCSVPLVKDGDKLLFDLEAEHMLLSKKPLSNFTKETGGNVQVPDLSPVHFTNSLIPENIYKFENVYPLQNYVSKYHPHTVFFYYDSTQVKNLFEEAVMESQILSRSLIKTFATAAAHARSKYGNDVKVLPEPISLQCVHTDGRLFHFAALQLNTLDLNDDSVKNIWYSAPRLPLFEICEFQSGTPVLKQYNPDVIKHFMAFYNNE